MGIRHRNCPEPGAQRGLGLCGFCSFAACSLEEDSAGKIAEMADDSRKQNFGKTLEQPPELRVIALSVDWSGTWVSWDSVLLWTCKHELGSVSLE